MVGTKRVEPKTAARRLMVVVAGLAVSVGLAALWHAAGLPVRTATPGYPITHYFTDCLGPAFVAACLAAAFGLGWGTKSAALPALGMVLPLPIAASIEIARDPTDHNLWPFEVVMIWLPTFAALSLAAYAGKRIASRIPARPESGAPGVSS